MQSLDIKLLTFHKANNYGALLQCYALSKVLKDRGHNVELINVNHHHNSGSFFKRLKNNLDLQKMENFRKLHLPAQTHEYVDVNDLSQNYPIADCYIVGSDQVWNPQITANRAELYFFNFLPKNAIKIAYSASFGIKEWEYKDLTESVTRYLQSFNAIGVRESDGVNICKKTFGVDAIKTLDPTLLLNDYNELIGTKTDKHKKTLVSYCFGKDEGFYTDLKLFSKKTGFKPVSLNDNKYHKGIKSIPFPSVKKWLLSLKTSSFVLTNSFHCMVFAILCKKPFVVLPANPTRISRMLNLLDDLGLKDRFFESYAELHESNRWRNEIDYDEVFLKLEKLKKSSFDFLDASIDLSNLSKENRD
ncbi:MAG: polysaccharide pyruvyl transferase family protein [Bacteroidales bacterium]|nr:polysaccharide pyruvyl transferase family protein [Bacteroidales bacterium]